MAQTLQELAAYKRHWRSKNPDKHRDYVLRGSFGISLAGYNELLENQGGGCAVCGQLSKNGNNLAVDHDHTCCPGKKSCGKCVRGLLCDTCNLGVGCFRDNHELCRKAGDYLATHQGSQVRSVC